jgi:hypothetical protein
VADRIEREIEEILSKLDEGKPPEGPRRPIPIQSRRRRGPGAISRLGNKVTSRPANLTPATLLFAGAGIMLAGLILSAIWGPFIWAAFGGVLLFMAAFVWSFLRPGGTRGASQPKGYYWRDRYIQYEPENPPGVIGRFKRAFRRR